MALRENDNVKSYNSLFKNILQKSGKQGLIQGLVPNLIGIVLYKGVGFFLYENLYSWNNTHWLQNSHYANELISAPLGGGLGQLVSYPFDVLKRNMMVAQKRLSVLEAVNRVKEMNGGYLGLYKGFTINLVKIPLANVISFTTRRFLNTAKERRRK